MNMRALFLLKQANGHLFNLTQVLMKQKNTYYAKQLIAFIEEVRLFLKSEGL